MSASDLNVMSLTGRLTKDAQLKTFPSSGKKFLEFDVANNTGTGDYAKVNYFKCIMLGDTRAEKLVQYLLKGQAVAVSGEHEQNDWVDKEGMKHRDWKLKVASFAFCGAGKKREGTNQGNGQEDFGFEVLGDSEDPLKKAAREKASSNDFPF